MFQGVETPEGNRLGSIIDRMLDEVEDKITFLSEELADMKKQIQQEKKRSKRRMLDKQIQRAEFELHWLRYQEEHMTKSIYERR